MKTIFLALTFSLTFLKGLGQDWGNVGGGLDNTVITPGPLYDLQEFQNKLYTCGRSSVRCWNDTFWKVFLPNSLIVNPYSLEVFNDALYIGSDFTGGHATVSKLVGASWVQEGKNFEKPSSNPHINCLLTYKGQLIAGGNFSQVGGVPMSNIASWNGTAWSKLGNGLNGIVNYLAEHNGELFASGSFTASGNDQSVRYIARWNGLSWSVLYPIIYRYSPKPMISYDSLLFIGGILDTINGEPMQGIAGWNGKTFSSRGNKLIHYVNKFFIFNKELYLCGDIYTSNPNVYSNVVMRWNDSSWEQVGQAFNQSIWTLGQYKNLLLCGGQYTSPTLYLAGYGYETGISEPESGSVLGYYPNPATDQLVVITTENGTLSITDHLGRCMLVMSIRSHETVISADKLSPGIYLVTYLTKENSVTGKLVIQR